MPWGGRRRSSGSDAERPRARRARPSDGAVVGSGAVCAKPRRRRPKAGPGHDAARGSVATHRRDDGSADASPAPAWRRPAAPATARRRHPQGRGPARPGTTGAPHRPWPGRPGHSARARRPFPLGRRRCRRGSAHHAERAAQPRDRFPPTDAWERLPAPRHRATMKSSMAGTSPGAAGARLTSRERRGRPIPPAPSGRCGSGAAPASAWRRARDAPG